MLSFINNKAEFCVKDPNKVSYLYFPLANQHGMMSSITPSLNGDAKTGQHEFALLPVSQESLHDSNMGRNVWFTINHATHLASSGNSLSQMITEDKVSMTAGFLYQKISREALNGLYTIKITSFVPVIDENIELHKVVFKNNSDSEIKLRATIATPIYGRSADEIRDHRHVTALLNKIDLYKNGIVNTPTLTFDERGHKENKIQYGVFAVTSPNVEVENYYPVLQEFIGEGGNLISPIAIKENMQTEYKCNDSISGYECMGGMAFKEISLCPHESFAVVFSVAIQKDGKKIDEVANQYTNVKAFDNELKNNKKYWNKALSTLKFKTNDPDYDNWLKWVTIQPILRRIYGCSFLPHHDYGRGGRGWRDLWQDCLALILMNPQNVNEMLYHNFAGVRIDGSNATIIGNEPGEFIADRNNIVRIWMDHAAWSLLTTKLYVDRSGDIDFLFRKQCYWKDQYTHYTKKTDVDWQIDHGHYVKTQNNSEYRGTILEHLLIQNIIPFYNVGEHNISRLEDADWNDGMDMAAQRGESVAFYALYADNLNTLSQLCTALYDREIKEIEVNKELQLLLKPINDFDDVKEKHTRLTKYFDSVSSNVSGNIVVLNTKKIATELKVKSDYIKAHIKKQEWLQNGETGWFNGYYDNNGNRVASIDDKKITLTGQVFPIMAGIPNKKHLKMIAKAADKFLYSNDMGGYRLNTDFKEVKMDLGRLFGFAYGHKENGAMFSHMAIMYSYALYKQNLVKQGRKVLNTVFNHCSKFDKCKIFPGIPEYIDIKGRGMYHYLTGSASWYLLTMVVQVYGIQSNLGDVILNPKLTISDFNSNNETSITTLINNKLFTVKYVNTDRKEYGTYKILRIVSGSYNISFNVLQTGVKINRAEIDNIDKAMEEITVFLG